LFPPVRIQKPGYDLYGLATLVLFILLFYTWYFDEKMTVSENIALKNSKKSNQVFKTLMALVLMFIATVMIIERYIARSDVSPLAKEEANENPEENKGFFSQEIFREAEGATNLTIRF
jgi:uncharacterized membrane protein